MLSTVINRTNICSASLSRRGIIFFFFPLAFRVQKMVVWAQDYSYPAHHSHHSLLPFMIHYHLSSFTTILHPSLLPFIIHCYPSSLTSTIPFSIHYYTSSFTTTLQQSYYPSHFIIYHYPSSFTATLHRSLLPFLIHYYSSAFTTLPFIIHCYP